MEQSQAQRRLVKSPPELWAERSSEAVLGRHPAAFGEIRITRAEPETTVAWEGDRASGTVALEPAVPPAPRERRAGFRARLVRCGAQEPPPPTRAPSQPAPDPEPTPPDPDPAPTLLAADAAHHRPFSRD